MSELSVNASNPEFDSEIDAFLQLPARQRFASIVADLVNDFGLSCELPLRHSFVDGMYMREIFIPKNTIIVGAVHKHECFNVCSQGAMIILDSDGNTFEVQAPFQAVSLPGIMKLGIATEDVIWTNVFKVESDNVEDVEKEIAFSDIETLKLIDPEHQFITKEKLCQLESLLLLAAQ